MWCFTVDTSLMRTQYLVVLCTMPWGSCGRGQGGVGRRGEGGSMFRQRWGGEVARWPTQVETGGLQGGPSVGGLDSKAQSLTSSTDF